MNQVSSSLAVKKHVPKKNASAFIDEAFMGLINWGVRSQPKIQSVPAKKNQQPIGK